MAVGTLVTPVDALTGMPLPIIAKPEDLNLKEPENKNWHHHFHPAKHPLLQGVGGIALRSCRMQYVPIELHNFGKNTYHDYFEGPPLPENDSDQFALTVLACAGYIPREGINISKTGPRVYELNDEQLADLKALSNNDYINFTYHNEFIREFFKQYALARDWSYLRESTIEEFLTSRDLERRRYLGHFILAKAIEMATDDIQQNYLTAFKEGLLHPQAPHNPRDIVKKKITPRKHKERLFKDMESVLAEHLGIAA